MHYIASIFAKSDYFFCKILFNKMNPYEEYGNALLTTFNQLLQADIILQNSIQNKCIHNNNKNKCIECFGDKLCFHYVPYRSCFQCYSLNQVPVKIPDPDSEVKSYDVCPKNIEERMIGKTYIWGKYYGTWDGDIMSCPHGYFFGSGQCETCGGKKTCIHGRNKDYCIECHGSKLCEHKKDKKHCVLCKGSSICCHSKRRIYCSECGGSGLCAHGRFKNRCKECGGSSICEHNKRRVVCVTCKGSQICHHNIIKYDCRLCRLFKAKK